MKHELWVPLGGEGEERGQGIGSRLPTGDERGWTFAPRSPKKGSPSKKKGWFVTQGDGKQAKEGSKGGGLASRAIQYS